MAILASSGFRGEQAAAVNDFEIAVGKLVSALRILSKPAVDPEMPFCIFTESMEPDKLILLVC